MIYGISAGAEDTVNQLWSFLAVLLWFETFPAASVGTYFQIHKRSRKFCRPLQFSMTEWQDVIQLHNSRR